MLCEEFPELLRTVQFDMFRFEESHRHVKDPYGQTNRCRIEDVELAAGREETIKFSDRLIRVYIVMKRIRADDDVKR